MRQYHRSFQVTFIFLMAAFCENVSRFSFQLPRLSKSWPSSWTKVLMVRSTWASSAKIWPKKMGEKRQKGFSKRRERDLAGTHLLMCRSHRGGTKDSQRFLTNVEKFLVPTSWQLSKYLLIRIRIKSVAAYRWRWQDSHGWVKAASFPQ